MIGASSGQNVFLLSHSSMPYTRTVHSGDEEASSEYSLAVSAVTPASCMPTKPTLLSSFMADLTARAFSSAPGWGHKSIIMSMALSQKTPGPGSRMTSPPGTLGISSGSKLRTAWETQEQWTSILSSIMKMPLSCSSCSMSSLEGV